MEKCYVYVYLNPLKPGKYQYDGLNMSFLYEPFYVGRGINNRYMKHILDLISNRNFEHNPLKFNILKKIIKSIDIERIKDYILFYATNLSNIDANELEQNIILSIGKRVDNSGPLSNITDGGEGSLGVVPWNKGKKYHVKNKKKRMPWNKGKKVSDVLGEKKAIEMYKKMVNKKEGSISPLKGKKNIKLSEVLKIKVEKEYIDKIINLYLEGKTLENISEILLIENEIKLVRGIIRRLLIENNIKLRTKAETQLMKLNSIKQNIIELYKKKSSILSILKYVNTLGYNIHTTSIIHKILINEGLK